MRREINVQSESDSEGLEEALDYMIETLAMTETMNGHDGSFYHEQLQLFHCDTV